MSIQQGPYAVMQVRICEDILGVKSRVPVQVALCSVLPECGLAEVLLWGNEFLGVLKSHMRLSHRAQRLWYKAQALPRGKLPHLRALA